MVLDHTDPTLVVDNNPIPNLIEDIPNEDIPNLIEDIPNEDIPNLIEDISNLIED
jgi:hypothetical protein